MIAAGTGLTPFMGFLKQREADLAGGKKLGDAWLFHGRRFAGEDGDALYLQELRALKDGGVLTHLQECISRDRLEEATYKYVQDGIKAHGGKLWDLVQGGASVFVCG